MKPKCVLVTGGAGYIGRHVCQILSEQKIPFVIVDNLSTSCRDLVKDNWPIVEASVSDIDAIKYVCQKWEVDACFHLAGRSIVAESIADPELYRRENVEAGVNLIVALQESKVDKIVFSSSCAVYGDPEYLPIDEDHRTAPVSPYGLTKLIIEQALRDSGLKAGCLRYFNACGGTLGEHHYPESHLIPLIVQKMIAEEPVQVYGADYPTRDGTAIRDFINVRDIAIAHLDALKYLSKSHVSKFNIWNLGSGVDSSVMDVINLTAGLGAFKPEIQFKPRRAGDPPMLLANATKAYRDLGWYTTRTLSESIIETLAVFQGDT